MNRAVRPLNSRVERNRITRGTGNKFSAQLGSVGMTLPCHGSRAGSIPASRAKFHRGVGKSGRSRLFWKQKNLGSNPSSPTKFLLCSGLIRQGTSLLMRKVKVRVLRAQPILVEPLGCSTNEPRSRCCPRSGPSGLSVPDDASPGANGM